MQIWVCNSAVLPYHGAHRASGTLVALSHSIRLRPGAHTGAECVLRATYQGRGNSGEGGRAEKGRSGPRSGRERERERGQGRRRERKASRGARSRARVKERRVDLESGREQRLRWYRGLV